MMDYRSLEFITRQYIRMQGHVSFAQRSQLRPYLLRHIVVAHQNNIGIRLVQLQHMEKHLIPGKPVFLHRGKPFTERAAQLGIPRNKCHRGKAKDFEPLIHLLYTVK